MLAILIPLAALTVIGLIALWPDDTASHIREDVSSYATHNTDVLDAGITKITEVSCDGTPGVAPEEEQVDPNAPPAITGKCGEAKAVLLEGPERGDEITVMLTASDMDVDPQEGQTIQVYRSFDSTVPDSEPIYSFADFERSTPLTVLAIVFVVAVVVVVRWRGVAALIGLAFAAFVLVKFMFPALVNGSDPVLVGVVGSSAIMFVVLYTSHGFSARTTTALLGTLFGLACTAGIGWLVNDWAKLTGVAGEDDFLLGAAAPDLRLTAVVLCGIIVAGLGVLNDVTITQSSAVWELAEDGDDQRIFAKAMRIGRDHIASSVYTIAFATAGAGLSSLLLITIINQPLGVVLQSEAISQELVRTLVGAIGLVLAMPLTTAIATAAVRAAKAAKHRAEDASGVKPTTADKDPNPRHSDTADSDEPKRPRRRRRNGPDTNDWNSSTDDWLTSR